MRIRLATIQHHADEPTTRREREFDVEVLAIGRSPSADLYLHDQAVALEHAEIVQAEDGYVLRTLGAAEMAVKGEPASRVVLTEGDRVELGPYILSVEAVRDDADLTLTIERVGAAQSGGEAVTSPVRDFAEVAPAMRPLAWTSFLVLLLVALVLPLAVGLFGKHVPASVATLGTIGRLAWNVGEMSNTHANYAADCQTCHTSPFQAIASETCLSCHATLQQHADPKIHNVAAVGCVTCHTEHRGPVQQVRANEAYCASCHSDLKRQWADTKLLDVGNFATKHPQFRPTVMTDGASGAVTRVSLDDKPQRKSNLSFNHPKHMAPEGILGPRGMAVLECQGCHRPEPGGAMFERIRMERDCVDCHRLTFEPARPDWTLPHGNVRAVMETVVGLYSRLALRSAQPAQPVGGLGLGRPDLQPERTAAAPGVSGDEVDARAAVVLERIYTQTTCRYCHAVQTPPAGQPLAWAVAPVWQPDRFMPKARFDHAKHKMTACADCHGGTAALAAEPVLPGIETCRNCHGSENAAIGMVASTCTTCHGFHENALVRAAHVTK